MPPLFCSTTKGACNSLYNHCSLKSLLTKRSSSKFQVFIPSVSPSLSPCFLSLFYFTFPDKIFVVLGSYWYSLAYRKQFFINVATQKHFDPLIPENWYSVSFSSLYSFKVPSLSLFLPSSALALTPRLFTSAPLRYLLFFLLFLSFIYLL